MNTFVSKGLMFPNTGKSTKCKPSLAVHKGRLVCMFVGQDNLLTWAFRDPSGWTTPYTVPDITVSGPCVVAEFYGTLYAAVTTSPGNVLIILRYDDLNDKWVDRQFTGQKTNGPQSPATLAAYNGMFWCAYSGTNGDQIQVQSWHPKSCWSTPFSLPEWTFGEPALFIRDQTLHLLFVSHDTNRDLHEVVIDTTAKTSKPTNGPAESSRFGLSAASDGVNNLAFVVFQYNADGGSFGLCSYSNSSWSKNVPTGAFSINTPAIAVYNNQVVVIWDSRDGSKLSWGTASLDLVIDGSQWMKPLLQQNPDMKLGSLTLPGSHDSCTTGTLPFVQTQRLSIAEQLDIGVRAFDIRLMLFNNEIIVVHGDFSATGAREILRLNDVLSIVYAWLDTHSTEGLVIQMKNDSGNEQSMADRLSDTFNDVHWRTASNAPSLQEIAGHIQLLRRFYVPLNWPTGKPLGINVRDGWVDNGSSFVLAGSASPRIAVEDLYDLQDTQPQVLKWTAIQHMLGLAANDTDPDHWFISYASGLSANINLQQPFDIAWGGAIFDSSTPDWLGPRLTPGVNSRLEAFLQSAAKNRLYGFIMMDYVTRDLVATVWIRNQVTLRQGKGSFWV